MKLTKTEALIYQAALDGHNTYHTLSEATGRSVKSLKFHLTHLYQKTGKTSLKALSGALIAPPPTSSNSVWLGTAKRWCDCLLSNRYQSPEEVPAVVPFDMDTPGKPNPVPVTKDYKCGFCGYETFHREE